MSLYRSISVGLLGAAVWLLARLPKHETVAIEQECPVVAPVAAPETLRVVDVVRGTHELVNLLHLAPDDRVVAVNDEPVTDDVFALSDTLDRAAAHRDYVDLSLRGGRRMLIVIH